MSKILFVVTGARAWTLKDGTQHPTGYWAEELVAPYQVFTEAGHQVVVATPGGVEPVVDEGSLAAEANGGQENADALREAIDGIEQLRSPESLEQVDLTAYDAVFYPGGHGPMEDLAGDAHSARLLVQALFEELDELDARMSPEGQPAATAVERWQAVLDSFTPRQLPSLTDLSVKTEPLAGPAPAASAGAISRTEIEPMTAQAALRIIESRIQQASG